MCRRIIVRNINDEIDSSELELMFASVGDVESAVIEIKDIKGTSHRIGYVQMATEQQTQDGILFYHGFKKNGHTLVVVEDKPHVPDPNYSFKKPMSSASKKTLPAAKRN